MCSLPFQLHIEHRDPKTIFKWTGSELNSKLSWCSFPHPIPLNDLFFPSESKTSRNRRQISPLQNGDGMPLVNTILNHTRRDEGNHSTNKTKPYSESNPVGLHSIPVHRVFMFHPNWRVVPKTTISFYLFCSFECRSSTESHSSKGTIRSAKTEFVEWEENAINPIRIIPLAIEAEACL